MSKKIIYTPKVAKPVNPYSQATLAGNLLFVAGTIAENQEGKIVGKGDIKIQTRQVLENIKAVIEAAGGTLRDVTRTTVYLTDFDNYFGMNEVYRSYFSIDPPARATVKVSLRNPDVLIEIESTAVLL
ncbi:MAG: RidA family protein [Pseudomonadota bacterium]